MSDWQVGDLALCVNVSPTVQVDALTGKLFRGVAGKRFRKGAFYTVERIGYKRGHLALGVAEDPEKRYAGAFRFVKVTPPEADEFDRETIEMEKRWVLTPQS